MRIGSLILKILFIAPLSSYAFDCGKAKTETEKSVCSMKNEIQFILNKGIENKDCDGSKIESAMYWPRLFGKIIGNGRIYFFKSPELKCKSTNLFLIKNDSVMIYSSSMDNKFEEVMFTTQGGNIVSGWIESKNITHTGSFGN